MPIETDIQDAIAKNLPAAVGDALRQRLEQADKLEAQSRTNSAALAIAEHALREERAKNASLLAQVKAAEDILKREAKLVEAENQVWLNQAVLAAESKLIGSFLDRQERIVLAVFANNRFKYIESRIDGHAFLPESTPSNSYPCPQTTSTTASRTVEGEGDVPALPPTK